jgi:hypothetical protein
MNLLQLWSINAMKYLSDMSVCTPTSALSKINKMKHWTLLPYETEEVSGVMIRAGSHAEAPEVTLPLEASGWYTIFLGFWNPHHDWNGDTTIRLKLTGDPCFQPISDFDHEGEIAAPMLWDRAELRECFFRCADLTGKDLVIAQQSKGQPKKAYVAYIKLIPLSSEEVASIQTDRADRNSRKIVATNDGVSFFHHKACTTKEELLEQFDQYRYSDIGKLVWAVSYGDRTNYPSEVGRCLTAKMADLDVTLAPEYRRPYECLDALHAQGLTPVQVALEHAHGIGLKFDVMFRMGISQDLPPHGLHYEGFLADRPELRMLAKDGTPLALASYAFPEVQAFMLSLIREVVETFDIDGVQLGWIRGPQFVGYEAPFVKDFMSEHGEDPRELDQNDIRAQRLRARYLTNFMRSVRRLLKELGDQRGREIELSAWGHTPQSNFFFGMDIETWMTEKLIDSFMGPDPEGLLDIARAHDCKFYLSERPIEVVLKGHQAGVDGFAFWDLNIPVFGYSHELPESWAVTSRMGHKNEVAAFAKDPPKMKRIQLKTVGDVDICHPTNLGATERGYWPPDMLPMYSAG